MADEKHVIEYQYTGDVSSLTNATQQAINDLSEFQRALNGLKQDTNLSNMKLGFESVSKSFGELSRTLKNIKVQMKDVSSGDAVEGFGNISQSTAVVTSALKGLITTAKAVVTVFLQVTKIAANGLVKGFKSIATAATKLTTKFVSLTSKVLGFNKAAKQTSGLSSMMKRLGSTISFISLGNSLKYSTEQAMDLIENLNLFQVAMGDSYEGAQKFIDKMADLYGMNPSNLYRYTGLFYQLTHAMGMSSEASSSLSISMTKMGNDIASLFNAKIEDVVDNLSSALQGASRAVSKYGLDVRRAAIQQTAYEYGLTESVSSMSEANKQALRYLTMHKQIRNAIQQEVEVTDEYGNVIKTTWGDFARNIETPANQMRIFKEQIQKLGAAIGLFFVKPLAIALAYINGFIMALERLISWIAGLFGLLPKVDTNVGFGGIDDATDSTEDLGDAIEETKKEAEDLLAPFDELNIIAETVANSAADMGNTGLDPRLEEAIKNAELGLEDFESLANRIRDAILKALGLELTDGEIKVIEGGLVDQIQKAFAKGDFEGIGKAIGNWINKGIYYALDNIPWAEIDAKLTDFMTKFARILNGLVDSLDFEALGKLIARLTNLVLHTFEAFLETFNWHALGNKLGDAIAGFLNEVDIESAFKVFTDKFLIIPYLVAGIFESMQDDWNNIGKKMSDGINAALDRVLKFINDFDWYQMSKAFSAGLETMIKGIDTKKLVNTLTGIFKLFGDTLRGAIDGLFTPDLAKKLTDGFNGLVKNLNSYITSADYKQTRDNLQSFIRNVIENVDWNSLGSLLGNAFEGIFDTLHSITIDLSDNSQDIYDGIDSMINSVDWNKLGESLGAAINLVFGAIITAIHAINWDEVRSGLVTGLRTAIEGLDENKEELAQGLSSFIENALALIGDLVSPDGLIMGLTDIVVYAIQNLDWNRILFELGIGIIQLALSLIELAINTVIYPIEMAVNAILTALGQETVDMTGKVSEFFGSASEDLSAWADKVREIHFGNTKTVEEQSVAARTAAKAQMDGMIDDVGLTGSEMTESIVQNGLAMTLATQTSWEDTRDVIPPIIGEMKTYASDGTAEIKEAVSANFEAIKTDTDTHWTGISTAIQQNINQAKVDTETGSAGIKTAVTTANSEISTDTSVKWPLIRTTINTAVTGAQTDATREFGTIKTNASNTWTNMNTDANTKWAGIASTLRTKASEARGNVTQEFNKVESESSSIWSRIAKSAWNWGKDMVSNIISGIKSKWNELKETVSELADTVKDFLGFSEPKKGPLSDFHTYMPDMMKLMSQGITQGSEYVIQDLTALASNMENVLSTPLEVVSNTPLVIFDNNAPKDDPYGLSANSEDVSDEDNKTPQIDVTVRIGDSEWDAFVYESAERGKQSTGLTPLRRA